jgi:hypothetical protein
MSAKLFLPICVGILTIGTMSGVHEAFGQGQVCVQCSEGEVVTMPCPGGFVSRILFASYGTPTNCPDPTIGGHCHATNSQQIVEDMCLNRLGGCAVSATNDIFGDPCFLTGKRLAVVYECTNIVGEPICVQADENDWESLRLECSEGTVISSINFASYGTPTACPTPALGPCHAASSRQVVEDACLGQQTCTLLPSNQIFGDPCSGTRKRLVISYTCEGSVSIQARPWGAVKALYR